MLTCDLGFELFCESEFCEQVGYFGGVHGCWWSVWCGVWVVDSGDGFGDGFDDAFSPPPLQLKVERFRSHLIARHSRFL